MFGEWLSQIQTVKKNKNKDSAATWSSSHKDYGHSKQEETSQPCKIRCAPFGCCFLCLEGLHKSAESQRNEAEPPAAQQISYSSLKAAR